MKLLERIVYALYRKRKLLMLILAVIVVLYPVIANAQDQTSQPQPETEEQITQKMQSYMLIILRAMSAIFWPILMLIGGLLDNSLIFDGKMGETLLEIWVQVRNIVNIIFVVILVLIALYNVLGLEDKGPESLKPLELKTALPKFVIALIAVNFSYIGLKVALDFTNVMTTAVFALPSQVVASSQSFQKFTAENEKIICEPDSPFYGLFCKLKDGTSATPSRVFNERGKAWFQNLDRSNLAVTMAMQFGQLPYANRIQDSVEGIFQLTFNIIFNLVLFIVFAISFIVLFIVLVARLPVLWLGIALSPVAALTLAFPPIKGLMGGDGGDLGKKFVKHAIAPLIIGVSLAIGYIMVSAMKSDPGVHNGDFAVSLLDIDPNALITRIDDLQEFLMAAATIAVVWMGVFAAAKDTIAQGVTEKIREGAQGVGKFVAKLPMYMQVIPYKPGKGFTMANLLAGARQIKTGLETGERGQSVQDLLKGRPKEVDEFVRTSASNPQGVFSNLKNNPGVLYHPDSQQHVVETIQHSDLSDADKQKWIEELRKTNDPRRFGEVLGRIAREHGNTQIGRLLEPYTHSETIERIGRESETMRNGAASGGGGTSGGPITNNTTLYQNQTLDAIIGRPADYKDLPVFRGMNDDQIRDFATKVRRLSEAEKQTLNAIPTDNGPLRFRDDTTNHTYQVSLLDAAIDRAIREAAQAPAQGGQPAGTPGVPPAGGPATPATP